MSAARTDERAFGIAASLRGEVVVEAGLGDSAIQGKSLPARGGSDR